MPLAATASSPDVASLPRIAVAAGTKCPIALAGQHDDADLVIVTGSVERVGQFEQGLWAERVALLRAVNRDLRDSRIVTSRDLVANVAIVPARFPDGSGLNG